MVANVAMVLNVLLVLGAMSLVNAVFTLPGIAGVILVIGMAVDANVLIYERLREEQAKGLSIRMALKNAYERAFSAIFDSNVTTLITGVILGWVGTEEVRGFAITLGLGVVFNLFTAVLRHALGLPGHAGRQAAEGPGADAEAHRRAEDQLDGHAVHLLDLLAGHRRPWASPRWSGRGRTSGASSSPPARRRSSRSRKTR